jgi:hypothetical protein
MFRRRRGEGRGCCVVIPVRCLPSVMVVVLLSGLAAAKVLRGLGKSRSPLPSLLHCAEING